MCWGTGMNKVAKSVAVVATALSISLIGSAGSFAADATAPSIAKVKLTPEQKAAFDTAKAQFQAARTARQAAVASAKASIASARSAFETVKAATTPKEARQAARATPKSAVEAVMVLSTMKPVTTVRP